MTPAACRQIFLKATAEIDLAIVEGRYDSAMPGRRGGSLNTLCQWLDLPRVAVVDCSHLNDCHFPDRPAVDALLLNQTKGPCDSSRCQTILESLWGIPVLGVLDQPPALREAIALLPASQKPSRELCAALGDELLKNLRLDRLLKLASRRGIPGDWLAADSTSSDAKICSSAHSNVHVAVAYDDAFQGYFPDTLDMLEARGATVRVFSPLRDECLPPETDIVYLGCGHPHEYAKALADNHCLMMALKEHICAGRRVYAEGGGLAYLCQHIALPDDSRVPMIGALRAVAHRSAVKVPPEPIEITLAANSWLGMAGTRLRGYRNANWQLEQTGCLTNFTTQADGQLDLIGRHQVIGSRVHFNFAAQPALLSGFMQPCPAALAWGTTQ